MSTQHKCQKCGGANAYFIHDGMNLCRDCHPPFPQEHRPALNALLNAGLIYPKEAP
jgi:hypothetical protein